MENQLAIMLNEGRLIRGKWTGINEHGFQTMCLLSALSPDAARARDANACPSSVMPTWFAHLTMWMNDSGTKKEWPNMVRRYANLASRWHVLDQTAWKRLEYETPRIIVTMTPETEKGDYYSFPPIVYAQTADKITKSILDAIEAAIVRREKI